MLRTVFVLIAFAFAIGQAAAAGALADVGPIGPVTKVHGEFKFTEGTTFDRQGNLFFSDIPAGRIYEVSTAGTLSVFHEGTHTNGLMFNGNGELVACEVQGQLAAYSADGKSRRVIAGQYNGVRFNAPDDLVVDRVGGVYFTDPHYFAPTPLPQGVEAVYYVDKAGKVTRLIDDLKAPNGVILSPDEKTLYVIPTLQPEVMAYPITAPGVIGKGRVFATLRQLPERPGHGGDGRAVDKNGDLFVATDSGVQFFSPQGKALGSIAVPEQPANLAFGGPDGKTLFIAARTSIYSVAMNVKGHVFPGK